jgi:hypothetical protein
MMAFYYAVLGDMNAKKAREQELDKKIAEVTHLPLAAVEARLDEAHGSTLLRTLFAKEWPNEAVDLGALNRLFGGDSTLG